MTLGLSCPVVGHFPGWKSSPSICPHFLCDVALANKPSRKLSPVEVLRRLLTRLEKRMEALQRVKLAGYEIVISELEVEQDYIRRAIRYLEERGVPTGKLL